MSRQSVDSHGFLWVAAVSFILFAVMSPMLAQRSPNSMVVPQLISYSGMLKDAGGRAVSGIYGVTFLIYRDETGGAPLWLETQNVQSDASGYYTVQLGAASAHGLPAEVFMSGEGRWLAVQIATEPELPRVLLVAVPYAMKAADAETIGGLPPSAFLLATSANARPAAFPASSSSVATSSPVATANAAVTGAGTLNAIPLWDSASDIIGSAISQTGSGATAKIGINNTAPLAPLDVKGATTIRGLLTLPTTGNATAIAGKNSQSLNLSGAAFESATSASVNQTFRLQTEPVGNDTASASGKLSFLYYSGANAATETGLSIASNGQITFAPGQTFPGSGGGSITAVTAGTALTGGGTAGTVTLNLDTTKVPLLSTANTFTANQTVNASLSAKQLFSTATQGTAPLNVISTTLVPNLNASLLGGFAASSFQPVGSYATLGANTFRGNQTITGNVTASGIVNAGAVNATTSFNLGGLPFDYAGPGGVTTFLGFAGNITTTGSSVLGIGPGALLANTSGSQNTATGVATLLDNTTGSFNTASGWDALLDNTGGGNNTATGAGALFSTTNGNNNTAAGMVALYGNTTGSSNTAFGSNAGNTPTTSATTGSNNTFVGANSSPGTQTALTNATAIGAFATVTQSNSMVLGSINGVNGATADTLVGIGTTAPAAKLDVHGTANFTGLVTFAAGQKFPGTGAGTITGVTAGTGLTGGGTTGGVTLNVDTTKVVTEVRSGTGLTGGGAGGIQTLNLDSTKVPLLSNTNQFTSPNSFSSNGLGQPALSVSNLGVGDGIDASSTSGAALSTTNSPIGVNASGGNYPIVGTQGLYEGVFGDSYTDVGFAAGIVGMEHGPTAATIGVFGESDSSAGWGVYGQDQATMSNVGATWGLEAGVWGDGGSNSDGSPGFGVGVSATADNGPAVWAYNSSPLPTIYATNIDPSGSPFFAQNTTNSSGCEVDPNGNLLCSGSKNAVVQIDGGARRVALAAIESPKNWFEDFGSAQLVDGVAVVTLEPDFAQTVNTGTDYKVFPVPNGDCKGLYVTHKTATSFEVRELGGGTSRVTFDYRITALRRNYENIRLADHSNDPVWNRKIAKRMANPGRFDIKKLIPPAMTARATSIHHSAESNTKP